MKTFSAFDINGRLLGDVRAADAADALWRAQLRYCGVALVVEEERA